MSCLLRRLTRRSFRLSAAEPQYASASASYLPRARVYSSNLRRYSAMAAGDGAVAAGRSAASALAPCVDESSSAASTHPQHLWSEPCRISSAVLARADLTRGWPG